MKQLKNSAVVLMVALMLLCGVGVLLGRTVTVEWPGVRVRVEGVQKE